MEPVLIPTKMDTNQSKSDCRSLAGLSGLSKAYTGIETFNGHWEENIGVVFRLNETVSHVCKLSDEEMANSIPMMLSGDALSCFNLNSPSKYSYK